MFFKVEILKLGYIGHMLHDCTMEAMSHGIDQSFTTKSKRHKSLGDNPCVYRASVNQNNPASTSMQIIRLAEPPHFQLKPIITNSDCTEQFQTCFKGDLRPSDWTCVVNMYQETPQSRGSNVVSKSF